MKIILLACVFILLSIVSCYGQTLDFALYTSVMATRATDFITTEQVLNRGGHEDLLPNGLVHSKHWFAAYEFGTGAVEIFIASRLKKRHPMLARTMLLFDISLATGVSAHNASISGQKR